jgi:hypothetical protein
MSTDGTPGGLAFFPGVGQVASCHVSVLHGISPSVFTLVTAPQDNFVGAGGTLAISDGNSTATFPNCTIDQATFTQTAAGRVWTLSILDRRWRWVGLGVIAGNYNLKNDDGTLKANTIQQTPRQLLSLCLDALLETGYDVGDVPNATFPTFEVDSQPPAQVLANLCDSLGCRVVLQMDNTIKICVVGQGQQLPIDGTIIENSLTIDPPEKPDSTGILCARSRYQVDFRLQAVGAESDGTIRPIAQLSYAPSGGWSAVDRISFSGVSSSQIGLAQQWIYRAYQIVSPLNVPEFGQVNDINLILPIEDEQVDTETDASGQTNNKPAMVFGQFCNAGLGSSNNNQTDANIDFSNIPGRAIFSRNFTIDRQRGIVKFEDQVFLNTGQGGSPVYSPAILYLRAVCGVRDAATWSWTRYQRTRGAPPGGGQFGTPTRFDKHDEIVYAVTPSYANGGNQPTGSNNNQTEVNPECDYYLDAIDLEYQTEYPQNIRYAGIRIIDLDGAIQQIVFSVGSGGATTTIVRNNELLLHTVPYQVRRAAERQLARDRRDPVLGGGLGIF